jgi:predicted GH43/DUF377 family glycosyl hydrolase
MSWERLGRIFFPSGEREWMKTHSSNPIAFPLGGDRFRIYFSTRDEQNRASIGFVEIDLKKPGEILALSNERVLTFGPRGEFDDSGVSAGDLVRVGERLLLYYVGWNLGVTVPFRNSIGLATSTDGVKFERWSRAPVLDRSETDPFSLSYPAVLGTADGFLMWYGSTLAWGESGADMTHVIKLARSNDGYDWSTTGDVCVGIEKPDETAFSRPTVLKDERYRMWYSFRGASYRIGYAESQDGIRWTRMDDAAGLLPSGDGWDSESVEYPSVFVHAGRTYLLYNGNRYGATGFGLAVRDGR